MIKGFAGYTGERLIGLVRHSTHTYIHTQIRFSLHHLGGFPHNSLFVYVLCIHISLFFSFCVCVCFCMFAPAWLTGEPVSGIFCRLVLSHNPLALIFVPSNEDVIILLCLRQCRSRLVVVALICYTIWIMKRFTRVSLPSRLALFHTGDRSSRHYPTLSIGCLPPHHSFFSTSRANLIRF